MTKSGPLPARPEAATPLSPGQTDTLATAARHAFSTAFERGRVFAVGGEIEYERADRIHDKAVQAFWTALYAMQAPE